MQLRNTRRALHEALDLIVDALEADARCDETSVPVKKSRRTPRQVPPLRPLSEFTEAELALARRKI